MEARGQRRQERADERVNSQRGQRVESPLRVISATALPSVTKVPLTSRQVAASASASVANLPSTERHRASHSGGGPSRTGGSDRMDLYRPPPPSSSFVRSRRRRMQSQDPDEGDDPEEEEEEEEAKDSLEEEDPQQLEALKAQQRRIRHREMKRRSRLRKKLEMEQLHATMSQLEEKYRSILNKTSPHNQQNERLMGFSRDAGSMAGANDTADTGSAAGDTKASFLQQKYTLLTQEIQQLRVQNTAFREKVMAYDRFTSSIETIMTEYQCPLSLDQLGELFDSLQIPPLSETLLMDLLQDSVEQIVTVSAPEDNQSSGRGSSDPTYEFMDWTEVRFHIDTPVEFSFSKLFGGQEWQDLCGVTWNSLTQTQPNSELTKHTRVTVLQRVHEYCVVVKRCVYDESLKQFAVGVFLVFRAETPHGLVMGLRSIQHPSVEEIKVQQKAFGVAWIEAFNWFLFQQEQIPTGHQSKWSIRDLLQDDSSSKFVDPQFPHLHAHPLHRGPSSQRTRVTFGGIVDTYGMEVESAQLMVVEILAYLVRWESMVRGEALLLGF